MNFEIAPASTEIKATWYDGKLYCFTLNIDGKIGWRLPTMEELCNIRLSAKDFMGQSYWSSEPTEFKDNHAWCMYSDDGFKQHINKLNTCWIRAIRDLTDN